MEDFRAAGEAFCAAAEDGSSAVVLTRALARLYAAALDLPELLGDIDPPPPLVRDDEWEAVRERVREQFGERERYWEVWQVASGKEPVLASLAVDIADVYREVKDGLLHAERGTAPELVAWHWQFGFRTHWGRHAVGALRVLHVEAAAR